LLLAESGTTAAVSGYVVVCAIVSALFVAWAPGKPKAQPAATPEQAVSATPRPDHV